MKHIKNLVFDLDDTLYPKHLDVESKFIEKIIIFFKEELGIETENPRLIMDKWRKEYGSDVMAVKNMGVDPQYFMDYICDIDVSNVEYNNKLKNQLNSLSHRKIIYTNSTHGHVKDVLQQLDIVDIFREVFTAKESDYILKPDIRSFEKFLEQYNINPKETAMFEDNIKNIETAKKLGMVTFFISDNNENSPYADYVVKDINEALDILLNKD